MALWFLRGLRKGIVTTRYPAAVDPWASRLPTPPVFDPGRLTVGLADRLVAVCPSSALRREASQLVLDLGACTACGRCLVAARGAAEPSGIFELAATRREDLVKRVAIGGDAG
jgi:dissimilatory sulfite reductase (desulfoviridin) alpha/beta subunit